MHQIEHDACGIGMVVNIDGQFTRNVVDQALTIVEKLDHRAGKDASGTVGDGVGILAQISHHYFKEVVNFPLGEKRSYAIAQCFLPTTPLALARAKRTLENIVQEHGLSILGWRLVPIQPDILGQAALDCMPTIEQLFIQRPADMELVQFEQVLYVIRRAFEKANKDCYICSLSSKTIVYKGMFLVDQLRHFYTDLADSRYDSAIAIVHSRFSTNTTPSWQRAHPNRYLAHNGEINTIRGNFKRMQAREESMNSTLLEQYATTLLPAIHPSGSDSAMLDNTLEFLVHNGIDLAKAVRMCIPEPWKNLPMDQGVKDFYHYNETLMEPWDGPAAVLFSDGDLAGATLDRNGLRPSRYCITKDGQLILASEVGVLDIDEANIVKKDRLKPGQMLLVDTKKGRLIDHQELKNQWANEYPYGEWLATHLTALKDLPSDNQPLHYQSQVVRDRLYKAFGYTFEDVQNVMIPLLEKQTDPIGSMGIDIPLALLSNTQPTLFSYFKQLFAQVTNPPMDALREELVTDTTVYAGAQGNLLKAQADNAKVIEIHNPILDEKDLAKLAKQNAAIISLTYYRGMGLKQALDDLFVQCERAYHQGHSILILSDRGVDDHHLAIPSLLAVSAVDQYFVKTKKRTAISILLESAEPFAVHHFACLLGFGATAIHPYLAHECILELIEKGLVKQEAWTAIQHYNEAILHGIVKTASKMGISTLQSYQSAQIFEAIGLSKELIDDYFTNTINQTGGIGLEELEQDLNSRHALAFDPLGLSQSTRLDSLGRHQYRAGLNKESHLYDPLTITLLQQATKDQDYDLFKQYSTRVNEKIHHLRDGFSIQPGQAISIDEVEPIEAIVKRFKTGAMSYGSISEEAHTCLALAMNQLGGKSNSGEGGELPSRLFTDRNSAIKQVASGRFGVTKDYLLSAKEIQIKMAQGAKPGEGGHLPGMKVYPWIASTRYSTPGVPLISPPPHHDIYSIEDLAQLIYDLKNANDQARISVKLVSEGGIGTIACGVAKAGANVILISGHDGGTGAAPLSSIHHAGLPWELGLSQSHRELSEQGLRSRVRLETDGKLMTGRDVAIAAMLGADEFGFATAPLVVMGCRMMRVCNKDTCPFGVATQNKKLRERFVGKPEYVVNFMRFIAQEVREILASLGLRTLDELIGHTEFLAFKPVNERQSKLEIEYLIQHPVHAHFISQQPNELEGILDKQLLPEIQKALQKKQSYSTQLTIRSTNRTFGTWLSAHLPDLDDNQVQIHCVGGAGQSFGAFIGKGLGLHLEGDANDYFGKGLSGGLLSVRKPAQASFKASENIIIGNVALYGATSGQAYINGIAGERFAVRNSGAVAVVEGCGDHGLEYMTGGTVVILGSVGKNFAAGMSGGQAFVYDPDHRLYQHLNTDLVHMEPLNGKADIELVQDLLAKHISFTQSPKAKAILEHFDDKLSCFKKVISANYQRIQALVTQFEAEGYTNDEAKLKAFQATYQKGE